MKKISVLGCGMVGSAIARDLASSGYAVKVFDQSHKALQRVSGVRGIEVEQADLTSPQTAAKILSGAETAVNAVPGWLGYSVLTMALQSGTNMVDISFMPEDPSSLDRRAREKGLVCLADMGVAPGLSNILFGRAFKSLAGLDRYRVRVGGLPVERKLPWQYKAPFSPVDVLEEYTRPARIVRNGAVLTLPALSEPELFHFPGIGTLEDFLTDGLRSLLRFHDRVLHMEERTIRYPGHRDAVLLLRDSGFLSPETIALQGGKEVIPLELTSRLLLRAWEMKGDDPDITVMLAEAYAGDRKHSWRLVDHYCAESMISAMARTTAYTCTAGVKLLCTGLWHKTGVVFPEDVGMDDQCFQAIIDHLAERKVLVEPV